ncbi:MAG: GNAT family N-acetyltransferase [Desulfovibrionales bacterium]|nr:GNAT family N-acetyltransferase [Desulfovibrionales bacterium]
MVIRDVIDADIDELLDVWEQSICSTHFFVSTAERALLLPYIKRDFALYTNRCAVTSDQKIVGFYSVSESMLEMLYVLPEMQRKGIGSALLDDMVARFGRLSLQVYEENASAVLFYQKHGYQIIKRGKCNRRGEAHPVLTMRLP